MYKSDRAAFKYAILAPFDKNRKI